MKFCMFSTFFGPHSFGGDAAYVDRLARALAGRGHEVHVVYCQDAFEAVRGDHPERPYEPSEGVILHPLKSPFGVLSPLATQVTGRPFLKSAKIRSILKRIQPEVVHFHNISLIGGPGLLEYGRSSVRLMTAHEHWLQCSTHLLWKNDEKTCDKRECIRCTLHSRRPPQYWRHTGMVGRMIRELDYLIFPSRDALERHRHLGLDVPMKHLPYFLPDDWSEGVEHLPVSNSGRPYIAAAGRLVRMKGFQKLIPLMARLSHIDLKIAGTGDYEMELRQMAAALPNVQFVGLCGRRQLLDLFHNARAVVVPSLFPETFGYVVLEAFAAKTPVIVHRGGGAIAETGEKSGGGLGYSTPDELEQAILALVNDGMLRDQLAQRGYALHTRGWSENTHLDRYFEMIETAKNRPHAGHSLHHAPVHHSRSMATDHERA